MIICKNMSKEKQSGIWAVIGSSSAGTLIEWYDFYVFGSLATILSGQFFPRHHPDIAFFYTLLLFAAGFIVRPAGALVFGRLGDIAGRKPAFLVTLALMGGSTFLIGLIPAYGTIGAAAPLLVLMLRLMQGLALGGGYGGAATCVAEHSPAGKRGFYTSWIQTTASTGLLVSLLVILATRTIVGEEAFREWGWRIPFLLSALPAAMSVYIRMKMRESPVFAGIRKEGKTSANPLKESFRRKGNLRKVLLALFGVTMGQGVVWYTGQLYAMSFIRDTCKIGGVQADGIIAIALLLGIPFFVFFGGLSDRIGRKWIMLAGMLTAVITYRPIYAKIYSLADTSLKTEIPAEAKTETHMENFDERLGKQIETVVVTKYYTDGSSRVETTRKHITFAEVRHTEVLTAVHPGSSACLGIVLLVFVQVLYAAMVYGPVAAFLAELFPTRIRYTSLSLPYHIGNGIFGGLTPVIAGCFFEASKTSAAPAGDPLSGLTYAIAIAGICFVIGALYLSNDKPEGVWS